jgi:hypothetical protein
MVAPLKASLCFVTPEGDRWRRRGLGTHASYTTNYTRKHKKGGSEPRMFLFGFLGLSFLTDVVFLFQYPI